MSVALSSDGRRALSGSLDRTMRLWDTESGKELKCRGAWVMQSCAWRLLSDGRCAFCRQGGINGAVLGSAHIEAANRLGGLVFARAEPIKRTRYR